MRTSFRRVRSIRYAVFVTMICAVAGVEACSSESNPTAPASVRSEPASELSQIRVSGTVVDDDGAPVPGVIVTILRWAPNGWPLTTVTDDRGFYSVSVLSAAGISARTEKEGYVSATHTHTLSRETAFQWDLRIYRMPKTIG